MKKILWILCVNSCLCGYSQNLIIKKRAASEQAYALSTIKKLTFTDGNMNVFLKDGNKSSFNTLTVQSVIFNARTDLPSVPTVKPQNEDIILFPNPANSVANIRFPRKTPESSIDLEVISLEGKIFYKKKYDNIQAGETIRMDVSYLNKGIYVLRINNGIKITSQKIIKI